jgi:hypothetical protein
MLIVIYPRLCIENLLLYLLCTLATPRRLRQLGCRRRLRQHKEKKKSGGKIIPNLFRFFELKFPFGSRFVRNRIVALMFGIKGFYSATDIRARTPDRLCHGATHGHDTGRNKTHMQQQRYAFERPMPAYRPEVARMGHSGLRTASRAAQR